VKVRGRKGKKRKGRGKEGRGGKEVGLAPS